MQLVFPLYSDKIQDVISIFAYLLRIALFLHMYSILEIVPWAVEKKVYSLVFW